MANKFADLRAMLSPESRVRSETIAKRMLAEMSLNEFPQPVDASFVQRLREQTRRKPHTIARTSRKMGGIRATTTLDYFLESASCRLIDARLESRYPPR